MLNTSFRLLPQQVKRWSQYLAGGCLSIALLALLGWQFDFDSLKRPLPGLAPMNPTTALCLFFSSASTLLFHFNYRIANKIAYYFSSLCLVIGVLRILEAELLSSLQVDQILYTSDLAAESFNNQASRMTKDGALSFILGSLAIFCIHTRWLDKRITQWLAVVIAFISWLTMLGYLYRVPEFYGELPYSPMAIHTAVALLLLALALITFHPEKGLAKEIFGPHQGSTAGWVMLPVIIIMPMALGYVRLLGHWSGKFSTEFGVALLVVSITLVVSIIVLVSIRLLNNRDAEQKELQLDQELLNRDLKEKNEEIHALNEELTASNEEMLATNEELTLLNEQLHAASEKIREQSETILQQKDEQLNRVLDSSNDVIWSIDLTGKGDHYISRSAEKIYGAKITNEMLDNRDQWAERTHDDDRHIRQKAREQLQLTGAAESIYRIQTADGHYRWVYDRGRLIYDKNNKPIRYEGIVSDLTEFKKQEESLNQYRENLDVIFSNTVEEILLLDHEGKVILFNRALENFMIELTGKSPVVGSYVWDTTSKDRSESSKALFKKAVDGESTVIDVPIKVGEKIVIHELRYQPVFIGKKVKYVTITSIDVTEKKRNEEAIRQSEANLRAIFDNTEDAFILLDKSYNIVMFNAATRHISTSNLVTGKNIIDIVPENRKAAFTNHLIKVKNGETVTYDVQFGEGQEKLWYHVTISVVKTANELVGYCITTNDYTAVKRSEIAIRESEERFRALTENSEDLIMLSDKAGKISYANSGVEKITGYTTQEFLSVNHKSLVHVDDRRQYVLFLKEVMTNPGKLINTNMRLKKKDGKLQWIEGTAVNLSYLESIRGIVLNFRDVTQRKKAEEEKSNLVAQLIEQNNDLRQFSFIASHNLRGPVASLLGLFNLFEAEKLPLSAQQLVLMANKAINHLDMIIRDLSGILEMRSHQLHAKEWVRMEEIFQNIQVAIQGQIDASGAEITLNDGASESFHTIKSYFHSILYNLLSNAVKYRAPDRRPRIKVVCFKNSSSTGFSVEDNGIGIDLELSRERIFGLYQRFHLEAEGKGLGLYMTKAQVQMLNGTIEVKSVPNEGTLFTVTFPLDNINTGEN